MANADILKVRNVHFAQYWSLFIALQLSVFKRAKKSSNYVLNVTSHK